jgi:hypothetical protein
MVKKRRARKHKPAVLDEQFEEAFAKIVSNKEPLVVVLRGHLMTEIFLNEILWTFCLLAAQGRELDEAIDDTYRHKLDAIYEGKLIEERLYRPLRVLNTIRNSLAHLPLKASITKEDEEQFFESFADTDKAHIVKAGDLKGRRRHPILIHGLTILFAALYALVNMYRKEGPRRFE